MEEKEEKKDIEVISGDGSNLDITPVYDHISGENRNTNKEKPKNIVVPKSQEEDTENTNDKDVEKKEEN